MTLIDEISNFFANKLSGLAIVFAILWWLFPQTLDLYDIYKDPNLDDSKTQIYHLFLGLVIVILILKMGSDFFPSKKISKKKFIKHQLK